jgi:hypothetical protein
MLNELAANIEEDVVSMFNTKQSKAVKIMKFKGEINKVHVCALLNSGNTHSFVNPSVLKKKGFRLVQTTPMVVVDILTKYSHFFVLSHHFTTADITQLFLENIYKLHGLPSSIVSDGDVIFTSKF